MYRDCDLDRLFSRDTTDVSGAAIILEQEGIQIVDENGSIRLTSDILKEISSLLRRTCYVHNGSLYVDDVDAILKNQNTITTDNSEADMALDEFLSTFTINKARLEVS